MADRGRQRAARPGELAMATLFRLWGGDDLGADGDGLVLEQEAGTYRLPADVLDVLEEARFVRVGESGAEVTYRGKTALAAWLARRKPWARAVVSTVTGERLSLERGVCRG